MRARHVAMVLVLLGVLVAGCSSSESDTMEVPAAVQGGGDEGGGSDGGGGTGTSARRLAAQDSAAEYTAETESLAVADGGDSAWGAVPALPERVIKTADLQLEVEDERLGATLRQGRTIAEGTGGFLLSTSISGVDRGRGEFVIRVPAERFEETLTALEELGTITGEDVRGEDVSQEFVDLEARLRNATAQEEVLFRLYDRSNSIADTIRVQRELEDVQLEIERLRGRLRFLKDRTDLSTISVSVVEAGAVTAGAGPFEKAWDTARKTFVAVVSGAIVGAGFLLPIAAFALLAYLVFRLVRPRLQRATP